VWFSTLWKSKYIAPADSTGAETRCNRRSKLKPCHLQWLRAALICRSYEFLDPDKWVPVPKLPVTRHPRGVVFLRQERAFLMSSRALFSALRASPLKTGDRRDVYRCTDGGILLTKLGNIPSVPQFPQFPESFPCSLTYLLSKPKMGARREARHP
jgi:hypothetical protein